MGIHEGCQGTRGPREVHQCASVDGKARQVHVLIGAVVTGTSWPELNGGHAHLKKGNGV